MWTGKLIIVWHKAISVTEIHYTSNNFVIGNKMIKEEKRNGRIVKENESHLLSDKLISLLFSMLPSG